MLYKYTSQRDDVATGLMYYKARYYDPGIGRFISADDIVPDAGNSQAYNRYMYVDGNPISHSDPTGHNKFTRWVKENIGNPIENKVYNPVKNWVTKTENWKNVGYVTAAIAAVTLVAVACIYFSPVIAACTIGGFLIGGIIGGTGGKFLTKEGWSNWSWKNASIGALVGAAVGFAGGYASTEFGFSNWTNFRLLYGLASGGSTMQGWDIKNFLQHGLVHMLAGFAVGALVGYGMELDSWQMELVIKSSAGFWLGVAVETGQYYGWWGNTFISDKLKFGNDHKKKNWPDTIRDVNNFQLGATF